jgi:hypothetical protein
MTLPRCYFVADDIGCSLVAGRMQRECQAMSAADHRLESH